MVDASRNTAVLLAGGVGTRVGLALPKQLIKIAGRPIMEHTLAALNAHPDIDDIIIMMTPGYLDVVHAMVSDGGYEKVRHVLEGAESRSHTALRALDAITVEGDPKVMTHDAVRPFVSARIISDCFRALDTYAAVDVAIQSTDTIVEISPDNTIPSVLPRATVRRGQTPQAFRMSVLRRAYARAMADPDFDPADDCTVVHRYLPEEPIYVVPGEERNIKVTEPIDVYIAEKLFQLASRENLPATYDDEGYRDALAGKTMVVFGGGNAIGRDIAELASRFGAHVKSFSRSSGTRVERREDIKAAAAETVAQFGSVDYVVNATGVHPRGTILEASEESIYGATEINYLAPVHIAQEFLPLLRKTSGSLLLFTAASYARGRKGYGLHSSAHAAVVNLTQALSEEWEADRVRVNCICNPERADTERGASALGQGPNDPLLDSDSIARACLDMLLSPVSGRIVDLRPTDSFALD